MDLLFERDLVLGRAPLPGLLQDLGRGERGDRVRDLVLDLKDLYLSLGLRDLGLGLLDLGLTMPLSRGERFLRGLRDQLLRLPHRRSGEYLGRSSNLLRLSMSLNNKTKNLHSKHQKQITL